MTTSGKGAFDAVSALDSDVFGGIHTSPRFRAVLGERGMLVRCLHAETALARAQGEVGLVPGGVALALASVDFADLNISALAERTTQVGYPIVGLVEQLKDLLPDGLGQYVHYGATTQDILDTAVVLQLRDACTLIEPLLDELIETLVDLIDANRDVVMVARSQGQHALPTTAAYRFASWLDPLLRHKERLGELRPRLQVLQLGGAVGTMAAIAPHGLDVRQRMADHLDLDVPTISWHATRDRFVEVVSWAAQVTASLAKLGLDVALSAQTEIDELVEASPSRDGSSSTMPQKRNPILSQQLIRAAKLVRTQLDLALDAAIADHDRATAMWSLEWSSVAPAIALAGGALEVAQEAVSTLHVHPDAMRRNLGATNGFIMSEAVMMKLAPTIGRAEAHDRVQDMVRKSTAEGRTFTEVLAEYDIDPGIANPETYLGHASEQVEAVRADADERLR